VTSQQVLAILEEGAAAAAPAAKDTAPAKAAAAKTEAPKAAAAAPAAAPAAAKTSDLSPAGQRVATENQIDPARVAGTGRDGRVTKEDLINFMRNDGAAKPAGAGARGPQGAAASGGPRPEERVPMTRMRAKIAERLMLSKNSIAMLTSFNEINLSKVAAMRKELRRIVREGQRHQARLHELLRQGSGRGAQAPPDRQQPPSTATTSSTTATQDISVAVSTDKGLVTPVLRDAQNMSFADVEKSDRRIREEGREGGLTLDDLPAAPSRSPTAAPSARMLSTPIVNPPQSRHPRRACTTKDRAVVDNGQVVDPRRSSTSPSVLRPPHHRRPATPCWAWSTSRISSRILSACCSACSRADPADCNRLRGLCRRLLCNREDRASHCNNVVGRSEGGHTPRPREGNFSNARLHRRHNDEERQI
jgi:2-oxoglutarate dehydrogenase E2 component (dihydrolipoamide succinyltransferase)